MSNSYSKITKLKLCNKLDNSTPFGIYETSQYKSTKPRLITYRFQTEPDEKKKSDYKDSWYFNETGQKQSLVGSDYMLKLKQGKKRGNSDFDYIKSNPDL